MNSYPGQSWSSRPHVDQVASRSDVWAMGAPMGYAADAFDDARQKTQQPIVTGSSVLGLRYKDGIMLATDTLASYGSLARFMDVRRLEQVGSNVLIGAGGDMSDWQNIKLMLADLIESEQVQGDGHELTPAQLYAYLTQVMYGRRSKLNPLWNALVVGGYDKKASSSFLGYVDLLGTTYQSSTIATGFGLHLAQPMLRKAVEGREDTLTESEARAIVDDCMRVLLSTGVSTNWDFAEGLRGYGPQTQ
ncbi:proteasome endopeptidase complex [Malassezia sp. CBS 17886]|nr:proteasome endopeptidase complex [Malassezia sp. CBS 17886]